MIAIKRLIDLVSEMPQVCFSADRELIEQLNKLAEQWNMARSKVIKLVLKDAVPVLFGKKPLKEGAAPTTTELLKIVHELERRVEKLEREKEERR